MNAKNIAPTAEPRVAVTGNPALIAAIRADIAAVGGQITFARFMDLVLYHPDHGYYLAPPRRPGRGGDFLTAPETHPFFGFTLARQIAECWERLGHPAEFVVREYGAGVGGLAYDLIAALTDAFPPVRAALRYELVETNCHRREQALAAFADLGLDAVVTAVPPPPSGTDLPPITGVVVANEVADAFPVHRLVVRDGALYERYVVWREGAFTDHEDAISAPGLGDDLVARLAAAGVSLAAIPNGSVLDISPAAAAWFAGVGRGLTRGYAIVLDYGYPTAILYRGDRLGGTLRAYHQHTVSDTPFRHVGEQDLTAHVDFTALERAGQAAGLVTAGYTTQGALLASLDLGDFLLELQRDPTTSAPDYLAAQAAVLRLIDPAGLGRFGVLIMARDAPADPPLRAFSVPPPPF